MTRTTRFESRALPGGLGARLRARLTVEHGDRPFSTLDPRDTVRRVTAIVAELGEESTVYRGGLDLRGVEVDHVWLAVDARSRRPYVVDVAFPLFADEFVDLLRRFVAGDAPAQAVAEAAARASIDQRVVGRFPAKLRYLGRPVWSARAREQR